MGSYSTESGRMVDPVTACHKGINAGHGDGEAFESKLGCLFELLELVKGLPLVASEGLLARFAEDALG